MQVPLHVATYLLLTGLFACMSPTDTCACSPIPPGEAVIYGTAIAEAAPMVGSEVFAVQLADDCRSRLEVHLNRKPILVGPAGEYEGRIHYPQSKVCVRVGIVPQSARSDTVWSAAIVAEFVINPIEAYRYRVDFVRPTSAQ